MSHTAVGSMSDWSGSLKDLARQIDDGSFTLEMLKDAVAHKQVCRLRKGDTVESIYKDQLTRWEDRWKRDLSGLYIPEHQEGFDRLLVIPQGMRPNKAFDRFVFMGVKAWRYITDLDSVVSDRLANADHAAWVRDQQEADDEFRSMSADDCLRQLVSGITLEEQLVFGEDYFLETGKHLNEKSITLCTGSRIPGGSVPSVRWHGGEVCVYWSDVRRARPDVGTRQVVS